MPFLQSVNKTDYLNHTVRFIPGQRTTKVECITSLPGVILKPYHLEILESKDVLFSF